MRKIVHATLSITLIASSIFAKTPTFNKNTPISILTNSKKYALCTHDPRESSNAIVFFDNSFKVSRDIKWMYSINKKHDTFYDLESRIGHAFMNALHSIGRRAHYKGTPVVDEYKKEIPMYWFFPDQAAAHKFITGLRSVFGQDSEILADASSHPLMIEFKNNDDLSSDDLEFLEQYFTLHTSLSSKKQKEFVDFVAESRRYIWDTNSMTELGKPEMIGFYGNNIAERAFEEALYITTKHFKELSIDKIASWIVIGYLLKESGLGKLTPKEIVLATQNGVMKLIHAAGYGTEAPQAS